MNKVSKKNPSESKRANPEGDQYDDEDQILHIRPERRTPVAHNIDKMRLEFVRCSPRKFSPLSPPLALSKRLEQMRKRETRMIKRALHSNPNNDDFSSPISKNSMLSDCYTDGYVMMVNKSIKFQNENQKRKRLKVCRQLFTFHQSDEKSNQVNEKHVSILE